MPADEAVFMREPGDMQHPWASLEQLLATCFMPPAFPGNPHLLNLMGEEGPIYVTA